MNVEEILAKLVAFKTVSRTPNDELIAFVKDYVTPLGFRVSVLPSDHPGRQSLVASIGPETNDGIVLSAHSDVVPVTDQNWQTDPFCLTKTSNKLFARGTSDMKGFLACMLIAARTASQADRSSQLKRPLHLAVSYDEEIGCVGVRSLLSHLKSRNFKASGCIIGEPTMLEIVTGHKGKIALKAECYGLSAHSSAPDKGCSAILLAVKAISAIEALQCTLKTKQLAKEFTEAPYSTVQVGTIKGGTAVNIIPEYCYFEFEMRLLPGVDGHQYVQSLQAQFDQISASHPPGRIELTVVNEYPGLSTPLESQFVSSLPPTSQAKGQRISFGTEGGLFQQNLELPVVVCGPGSISRAHKADEWISTAELEAGVQFLNDVVSQLMT